MSEMTLENIRIPLELPFENIREHCPTIATELYVCVKCCAKDINSNFTMRYGLHHWFLCKRCTSKFLYLVRNPDALNDVPEGYGQWVFDIPEMDKNE